MDGKDGASVYSSNKLAQARQNERTLQQSDGTYSSNTDGTYENRDGDVLRPKRMNCRTEKEQGMTHKLKKRWTRK